MRQPTLNRRDFLAGAAALAAAPALAKERVILNDASRLNPTPVDRVVRLKSDPARQYADALRAELKAAKAAGQRVAVGAARHSMGGQSLPRDGAAVEFDEPFFEVDSQAQTYRVSAGARWAQVIGKLDPLGFSPKVMQSNHDFGVASTFSVNAHGWPVPYGPFGSTVKSLRLMLASGDIVECSRDKESELFALAMGGYGLVGIILDLDVEMAPNALLQPTAKLMPAEDFAKAFMAAVQDPAISMAYGRLNVARASFFSEALLTTYHAAPAQPHPLPPATHGGGFMGGVGSRIYRNQTGSELGKRIRWAAETKLDPALGAHLATRNSLMNEPVANLANPYPNRTDILHEYFVDPDKFTDFLHACREVIPPARAEFLNVTLRYVAADEVSVLAHSPRPRIAAVMSFSQEISPEGEVDMMRLTERLIDRIVAIGGAFYLPYRLHARRDQVAGAYVKTPFFVERKRHYDPDLLFRNAMWDAYFA
jgi:FAD/FMN-containing dehydrogenase